MSLDIGQQQRERTFRLLDRKMYTDAAIFEREYDKIFSKQWLLVGHVSQLPEAGSYFVEEVVGESVMVVRNGNGEINAFLNVCRHRGHRVCDGDSGTAGRFVCKYHRWSYGLDGKLLNAPATPDGQAFDYSDFPLFHVHLTDWNGFLFICLGKDRPDELEKNLGPVTPGIEVFETENIKEIFREKIEIHANWKTLLENFLECHHCTGSHPELSQAMDLQATFTHTQGWVGGFFGGATPIKSTALTVSPDGQMVSIPLGSADPTNPIHIQGAGIGIVPTLTRIIVHIDHVVVHILRPVSTDRVEWHSRWFVNTAAVENQDYDVERVISTWRATNWQDSELAASAYAGVRSRRFESGPIHASREAGIEAALEVYHEMMA